MNELYISVRNLTKSFGKRKVVDDLLFEFIRVNYSPHVYLLKSTC